MSLNSVAGFNVPELLGFDDALRVIEMTIVKRPFVLDFAGAYLDVRPQFSAEVWADWETWALLMCGVASAHPDVQKQEADVVRSLFRRLTFRR